MRELANASARIAINRSVQVQTRDTQLRAAFSIACAVGAAVCGIACFLLLPGIMRYLSAVMTAVVAALSGFVKNIGALAMMMPVAFQLARRTGTPPSALLMPSGAVVKVPATAVPMLRVKSIRLARLRR